MAIKVDRQVDSVELRYFLNETAVNGKILVVSTAGSGVAMDSTANLATVAGNSSGNLPIGMLLNEVVNVDQTRQNINWHKDQTQQGDKVTIMTKGWAVTDELTGTIAAGNFAILSSSGTLAQLAPGGTWNEAANPKCGVFRTNKSDTDGFATVYIDL